MKSKKLTLFANDDLVAKIHAIISEAQKSYPWIDYPASFVKFFEFYGDGNHGFDNDNLNAHGFRIVPVCLGSDNELTDVATLFVASDFENMPSDDRTGAQILDEVEVQKKDLTDGFLFLVECDPDERKVCVRNFSQKQGDNITTMTY